MADCTSPAMACPLSRINSLTFVPGDSILLQAGQTFSGGSFTVRGNGAFATSTYTSTYASSLATLKATCVASSEHATLVAAAQAAGATAPEATAWGSLWCDETAMAPAQDAAWAAAAAATQWITIGRYGTGANPILDGGGTTDFAIMFGDRLSGTGGWRVRDLEIRNYDRAGIYYENVTGYVAQSAIVPLDFTGPASGVWLHDLSIHDIARQCTAYGVGTGTDCPVHPQGNRSTNNFNWPAMGQFYYFVAVGIELMGANYARLENLDLDRCDNPVHMFFGRHWQLRDVDFVRSWWEHPTFFDANILSIVGMDQYEACYLGYPDGSAGIFIAVMTDVLLQSSTVRGVRRPTSPISGTQTPDGVDVDFEADVDRAVIDSCTLGGLDAALEGGYGPALLVFNNGLVPTPPGPAHGANIVSRSVMQNNGLSGTSTLSRAAVGGTPPQEGTMLWWSNNVLKPIPPLGQSNQLWQRTGVDFNKPTGWLFGSDNTVTP